MPLYFIDPMTHVVNEWQPDLLRNCLVGDYT
jgi:hypothetical protein